MHPVCRQIRAFVLWALLAGAAAPLLFAADDTAAAIRKLLGDAASIGPAAGAIAPVFQLKDQRGREQTLQTLAGPKGLVLVFFRSADW
jgi:cytochrome oxidase Cu insertion factor (SCO1/SenC/PrrC family)